MMEMRSFLTRVVFGACLCAALPAAVSQAEAADQQRPPERLKVSSNGRFLVYEDGRPFFYLGDTAWELFHRLNLEDAERYLKNRAAKGFTVIQAVVLAELDGLGTPNANGDLPLIDKDPTKPNEAYFRHVDKIVEKAAESGLYIGMLPTWGDKVGDHGDYIINEANARTYGRFIGRRYAQQPIIWILGGDRPADVTASIWTEMAKGIKEGDGGQHLITFHPYGGSQSSTWFHYSDWLDFNMLQSGHNPTGSNYARIVSDYNRRPPKPCMDGEPAYEYPPNDMPAHRAVGAMQVRSRAYWALFSGAHGHTYGTHPIWQMYAPPRTPLWDVHTPWYDAMDLPGAMQLRFVKALLLSRPYLARIPEQEMIYSGIRGNPHYVVVTRDGTPGGKDATYVMAYFPQHHKEIVLKTERIAAKTIRGWWFNPRDGSVRELGTLENKGRMGFVPPTRGEGEDWVLVLDDASKGYPPPGASFEQARDAGSH